MDKQHIRQRLLPLLSESDRLVVHLATENAPYLKRGGLGDILESLPQWLSQHNLQNVVMIPFYVEVAESWQPELVYEDAVTFHGVSYQYSIYGLEQGGVYNLFVQLEEAFTFAKLYQDGYAAYQAEVSLNHFMFGKVVAHFLSRFVKRCVLFTHDWHVGAVYPYLKKQSIECQTFHVIHNYHYQGEIFADILGFLEEEIRGDVAAVFDRFGSCTLSAIAVEHAGQVVTVSPQYAAELMAGQAPHPLLKIVRDKSVKGILNGMHSHIWNPSTDPLIPENYSIEQLAGKMQNKRHLIEKFNLQIGEDTPILAMVSRLTLQKGIDLLVDLGLGRSFDRIERMEQLLDTGVALVICGTPEGGKTGTVDQQFRALAKKFPGRFLYLNRYSEQLAHEVLAGSDLLLHPSRFEPCGLTQMHAMAYGTLPIVTAVGGLKDTVTCAIEHPEQGFGFHMHKHTFAELVRVLEAALVCYQDPSYWLELVTRAMEQQNGWEVRIEPYLQLIEQAIEERSPAEAVK